MSVDHPPPLSGPRTDIADKSTLDPRRWAGLSVIGGGLLITLLSNLTLLVAVEDLRIDLGATATELQWILEIYPLAVAALLFPMAALGDRWGRRLTLMAGVAVFALASALGALATTPTELILARAATGIGGALILPATLALVRATFPDHERSKALAVWSATAGLSLALGPLISGVLLDVYSWPAVLWLNVPLAVALLIAAPFLLRESRNPSPGRLDLAGAVLSAAAVGGLVFGVIEGPVEGWTSPLVLGAFGLSLAALALFVAVEAKVSSPLVDLAWFRNRRFSTGAAYSLVALTVLVGIIYLSVLFLQQQLGYDALESGIRMLPLGVALLLGAGAGEQLFRRFGPRIPVVAGLGFSAGGAAAFATAATDSEYLLIAIGGSLIGLGGGLVLPALTESVLGSAPEDNAATAGATSDAAIEIGAALGIAVLGSVLLTTYGAELDDDPALAAVPPPAAEAIEESYGAALGVTQQLPPEAAAPILAAAESAFLEGFTDAAVVAAVLGGVGAVIAIGVVPMGNPAAATARRRENQPA